MFTLFINNLPFVPTAALPASGSMGLFSARNI